MQLIQDNQSIIELLVILSPIIGTTLKFCYTKITSITKKISIGMEQVTKIYNETQPNHGGSLFDRIKRIENILFSFHNRNTLLLSLYKDGIYECDKTGKCTWTNKALQDILGLDESELLGNGWLKCINEEDRVRVWEYWLTCIEKHIPYETKYKITNNRTNKKYLVHTIATPHINQEGEIFGFFGLLQIVCEINE